MYLKQLIVFAITTSVYSILIPPFCDLLVVDPPLKCYYAKDCESYRKCLGSEYDVRPPNRL